MKKILLLAFFCIGFVSVNAQVYYEEVEGNEEKVPPFQDVPSETERAAITVGILQGGGSLIGADLEFLLTNSIGLQVGAGFIGYGAALNFHLKPSIRSSFISMALWHQGMGKTHSQTIAGPTFVYRAPKWFTAQIGLGFPLEKGPAWPTTVEHPSMMLMYSIGAYFPLK